MEEGVVEYVAGDLGAEGADCEIESTLSEEVEREFEPDEEEEAEEVVQEVREGVTLVPDRGGEVVRPVAFGVVVLDVVVEVGVEGVAQEGLDDVREGLVEPGVFLLQDSVAVDVVVEHEGEGSGVVCYHETVEDGVGPGEVVEQKSSALREGEKVDEDMGEEDDVCWTPNDPLSPSGVRFEDVLAEEVRLSVTCLLPFLRI